MADTTQNLVKGVRSSADNKQYKVDYNSLANTPIGLDYDNAKELLAETTLTFDA